MTTETTPAEMTAKIEAKILRIVAMGYTRKEAEKMITKALLLVSQGRKAITDIIDL